MLLSLALYGFLGIVLFAIPARSGGISDSLSGESRNRFLPLILASGTEPAVAPDAAPVVTANGRADGSMGGSTNGQALTDASDTSDASARSTRESTSSPGNSVSGSRNGATGPETAGQGSESFLDWLDDAIRKRLVYPERARIRNAEGTVTVTIRVPADGSRCEAVLAESSGYAALDRAALDLVTSLFPSKISPGREFSSPVRIRYQLEKLSADR